MPRPSKQDDLLARFSDRYSLRASRAGSEVERQVIGANVGANGYTTLAQADHLIEALEITAKSRLLDIGSGRGWPGLYVSAMTGCRAVLSDLPKAAVHAAERRRQKQQLGRTTVVRASATHLPFVNRSFDAICHADTL